MLHLLATSPAHVSPSPKSRVLCNRLFLVLGIACAFNVLAVSVYVSRLLPGGGSVMHTPVIVRDTTAAAPSTQVSLSWWGHVGHPQVDRQVDKHAVPTVDLPHEQQHERQQEQEQQHVAQAADQASMDDLQPTLGAGSFSWNKLGQGLEQTVALAAKGETAKKDWPFWWMAPFFDRTSFGKEAAVLMLGLMRSGLVNEESIWVGTTQGDCKYDVDDSMPRANFDQLDAANKRWSMDQDAIVVCHSLPFFWGRPKNKWPTCFPCPPVGYKPAVTIGRAMAETTIYHSEFVKYCNRMDEVWVPSQFSVDILATSGVEPDKLRIVPIATNTTWFDPARVAPIPLPVGDLVFGKHRRQGALPKASIGSAFTQPDPEADLEVVMAMSGTSAGAGAGAAGHASRIWAIHNQQQMLNKVHLKVAMALDNAKPSSVAGQASGLFGGDDKPVVFISCFKWEMRKGWDVLLSAYLQEFTSQDNVELYILTKPFMAGGDFKGDMHTWVKNNMPFSEEQQGKLPTLYVISNHLTDDQYAGLLKSSDAYVIATRGEGWGMPISEAMSMGLPVVVTNWSGVVDFVDEKVGYMVDYDLEEVPPGNPWWFHGAKWAKARVDSMRARMREVVSNRYTAAAKGRAARQLMVDKYSPEAVAVNLATEINRVKTMLRSGKCGSKCHNSTWVAAPGDVEPDMYTGKEDFIVNAS